MNTNTIPGTVPPNVTASQDKSRAVTSLKIHRITVNQLENPVGVDPNHANIRWAIDGCGTQSAFQILLTDASGNKFDSRKIDSPVQSYQVPVDVLNGCQVYDLELSMWTKTGELLNARYERFIITSLSTPFSAHWIWSGKLKHNNHLYFRHTLPAPKEGLVAAIVYISGDDYYKLSIDGRYIGEGPARCPVESQHYNTWDITKSVQPGQTAMLGIHAYYMGIKNYSWVTGNNHAGVIAQIHYIYSDGTELAAATDGSWELSQCNAFLFTHMLGYDTDFNENIDARKLIAKWDTRESRSNHWEQAHEIADTSWKLVPQETPPLSIYDLFPQKIDHPGAGHYIIDFGKEHVGCFALKAAGEAGREIQVRLGEELNPDGSVRFDMRANCTYQERFTLSGAADQFEQYVYKAFRYAELINYPGELTKEDIRIIARHAPFDDNKALFQSSDRLLNQIWELCKHGLKQCNQDVIVDCPTREKAQYPGDLYIQGHSSYLVAGESLLQKKAMDYYMHSIDGDSIVNTIYPSSEKAFFPDYACILFNIAQRYYLETGAIGPVRKWFPALELMQQRWTKMLTDEGLLKEILPHGIQEIAGMIVIDWPPSFRDDFEFVDINTVINALYYSSLKSLAFLFSQAGQHLKSTKYSDAAHKIKTAMNRHLLGTDGLYVDGLGSRHNSFHATLYCLKCGVTPDQLIEQQLEYLMGRGMVCGVYVAAFFLETLLKYRKADYALQLMLAKDGNSWAGMLDAGATACTESWKPEQKENMSWCHSWSSAPLYILPAWIMGIRPLTAGYTDLLIDPQPGNLQKCQVAFDTISGRIELKYTNQQKKLRFELTVPFGTTCTFKWQNGGIEKAQINGQSVPADANVTIENIPPGNHTVLLEQ